MFTCKTCGKKFKPMQELGGHTSMAHPQNDNDPKCNDPAEVEAVAEETKEQPIALPDKEDPGSWSPAGVTSGHSSWSYGSKVETGYVPAHNR